MVDLKELIDKINVKEFIAITAGLVGSKLVDVVAPNVDPKQRLLIKIGGGLAATYLLNDMAEKYPEYSEWAALAGLATTALAAKPVADRITVEVSKRVGAPVVVTANVEPAEPEVEKVEIEEEKPEELAIEM